jgi:uncharacterized damage-inducible protein DinB
LVERGDVAGMDSRKDFTMNANEARAFRDIVVGFVEHEAGTTARVIAALPDANRTYRPDDRSRTGWELAAHIALSDVWFADSVANGAFVWNGEPAHPSDFVNPKGIADWYERTMKDKFAALRRLDEETLTREVDFFGRKAPAVLWLLMQLSHMVHHRGQLAAYLRAAGGKVPAIYGVSADENLIGG